MLKKIISGGQTGADQGGLEAGKVLGLETGGTIPKGWRTDAGRNYSLHLEYGLEEHPSPEYPPRTRQNVLNSDGTVIFGNTNSPGSSLTIRLCRSLDKRYLLNPSKEDFLAWLGIYRIDVLNVAGNRERTNPGIFNRTRHFLLEALRGEK